MGAYKIKSRIWICTDNGTFLGEGRVQLLKRISEYGSISKAAKSMKMSYKKAWELVDSMNKQSSSPLVKGQVGGKNGGGSELSELGMKVVSNFEELQKRNIEFLNNETTSIVW